MRRAQRSTPTAPRRCRAPRLNGLQALRRAGLSAHGPWDELPFSEQEQREAVAGVSVPTGGCIRAGRAEVPSKSHAWLATEPPQSAVGAPGAVGPGSPSFFSGGASHTICPVQMKDLYPFPQTTHPRWTKPDSSGE